MVWYYAIGNEQKGPVEQAEFDRLIQQGVITSDTLVWRDGLANWQPWSELSAPAVPPSVPPVPARAEPGAVVCSECGHAFPLDQVIRLGQGFVCAACKPIAMQKLREGVANPAAEQFRKDHISHEASVKSAGFLYFLGAAFLLLASTSSIGLRLWFGFFSDCCWS